MEKLNDMEQKRLMEELNEGKDLASQLKKNLGPVPCKQTCENLVQKILSSYDNALAVLNWTTLLQDPSPIAALVDPTNACGSYGDSKLKCRKTVIKKRKTLPRWSEQVRGVDGRLEDGYSWRKYGQKEILGATHPRAYYRCTHRNTKNCVATKQVQKSDEDSSIFEVTYRGKHSCMLQSSLIEDPKNNKPILQQGLKVENQELNPMESLFPSFSFITTSMESENLDNQIFGETLEHNIFLESYSPPATSELLERWQSSESDMSHVTDIISTPSSVNDDSPFGLVFSIDQINFDPDFPLDNFQYLS